MDSVLDTHAHSALAMAITYLNRCPTSRWTNNHSFSKHLGVTRHSTVCHIYSLATLNLDECGTYNAGS